MLLIALKMMIGDRAKFIGILFGLTFATFIITQQSGIFVGLMMRTYGFITDTSQPDVWVMDKEVQFVDDIKPIKSTRLFQVRGVEGVKWAVPMYKGLIKARLAGGNFQLCNVIGIDNSSLIGGPPKMVEGSIKNLRDPHGVIINTIGAKERLSTTSPAGQVIPMRMGEVFELNDRRAKAVGFCKVSRTFQSQPVIYTTFSQALVYAPGERNLLSFVLVKSADNVSAKELTRRIEKVTNLAAYTQKEFIRLTLKYYLLNTGIPINFGIAVLLGFIIGTAIAGQTFYNFAHDNLRYFATYKAMGASNRLLTKMVIVQALMTAALGWGIGIGLTCLFGFFSAGTELSFTLPWWLLLGSAFSIFIITLSSALVSLIKILRLEPAIVFQS